MERFVTRHGGRIAGILSGFDRMIFRGTLRSISYPAGLEAFLATRRVLLKDFGRFAQRVSDRVKQHAETLARTQGRPFEYVASAATSKETIARAIMTRDGITDGLICVLSCVEPCRTYDIHRDRVRKQIHPVARERKCLHIYFYYVDRAFGFMHVRVQTWLPLTIDVYVNGREWLARRLTRAGVAYTPCDNCFTAIADFARAQRASDELTALDWPTLLTAWARRVMPWLDRRSGWDLRPYLLEPTAKRVCDRRRLCGRRRSRHDLSAAHPPRHRRVSRPERPAVFGSTLWPPLGRGSHQHVQTPHRRRVRPSQCRRKLAQDVRQSGARAPDRNHHQ